MTRILVSDLLVYSRPLSLTTKSFAPELVEVRLAEDENFNGRNKCVRMNSSQYAGMKWHEIKNNENVNNLINMKKVLT